MQLTVALEHYLACNDRASVKSDPLKWWERRHADFPRVWALAEKYLAVPATSCPSERAFSSAGNVISKKRSNMRDDTASDTIFVRENSAYMKLVSPALLVGLRLDEDEDES